MSAPLLTVDNLRVAYGGVEALRGVSLTVQAGAIVAVLGANGAGKSTLLNALMGVLPASGGRASLNGRDLAPLAADARVRGGIALVPERRELFASMSVADNLALGAYVHRAEGSSARAVQMEEVFLLFPRLKERAAQRAGTLSGGERQMLAMGRALMARPRLLMLDEPSLGLAPLITREVLAAAARLAESGVGVLLVEQNARAALDVAASALVLEGGAVALEGSAEALRADPRVARTYLGGSAAA